MSHGSGPKGPFMAGTAIAPASQTGAPQYRSHPDQTPQVVPWHHPRAPGGTDSGGGQYHAGAAGGMQVPAGGKFAPLATPPRADWTPPFAHGTQPMGAPGAPMYQPRPLPATVDESDPSRAGVGLFFQQTVQNHDRVYVRNIIRGGSADREGSVRVNDVIKSIDGSPSHGLSLDKLRALILGEAGTFVTLEFERQGATGTMTTFIVALMRGNAEYFSQLKLKGSMQEEVERLRQALVLAEEELERLRRALKVAESQVSEDEDALRRLRVQLGTAEEQLRTIQAALKQEQLDRRQVEARVGQICAQTEQDTLDVRRLQDLLDQAHEKLAAAEESLGTTRGHKRDQELQLRKEQTKRVQAETQEAELMRTIEQRTRDDREANEREMELLKTLEEQRKELEREIREEESRVLQEERMREESSVRVQQAAEQRMRMREDNTRLLRMLSEAEEARVAIERSRNERELANREVEDELTALQEQARQREEQLAGLRQRIEHERRRWEEMVGWEQESASKEEARVKAREAELLAEMRAIQGEMTTLERDAQKQRTELEWSLEQASAEMARLEEAVRAEEELSHVLRERLAALGEDVERAERQLAAARDAKAEAEAAVQAAEEDRLRALERERAMLAELEKLEADQSGLTLIEDTRREMAALRAEKERALEDEVVAVRQAEADREAALERLTRLQELGKQMVEEERRRLAREEEYKALHQRDLDRMERGFLSQETLREALAALQLPLPLLQQYIDSAHLFPDTVPGTYVRASPARPRAAERHEVPEEEAPPPKAPTPTPPPVVQEPAPAPVQEPAPAPEDEDEDEDEDGVMI